MMVDRPAPPLSDARKVLVAAGIAMFVAQVAAAVLLAPLTTGKGDANAAVLLGMWIASIAWSGAAALLVVRYADLPDVATASMIITIAAFGAFTFSAAWDVRGTEDEANMTDALFLGVTAGAITAMIVLALAMGVARVLRLPVSDDGGAAE